MTTVIITASVVAALAIGIYIYRKAIQARVNDAKAKAAKKLGG